MNYIVKYVVHLLVILRVCARQIKDLLILEV